MATEEGLKCSVCGDDAGWVVFVDGRTYLDCGHHEAPAFFSAKPLGLTFGEMRAFAVLANLKTTWWDDPLGRWRFDFPESRLGFLPSSVVDHD